MSKIDPIEHDTSKNAVDSADLLHRVQALKVSMQACREMFGNQHYAPYFEAHASPRVKKLAEMIQKELDQTPQAVQATRKNR